VPATRRLAQGQPAERQRSKERIRCLRKPLNAGSQTPEIPNWPTTTARSFSTVAKLIEALKRSIPEGTENAERKKEALRLGSELLRGTKYEEE
jgi:hypothetical protein